MSGHTIASRPPTDIVRPIIPSPETGFPEALGLLETFRDWDHSSEARLTPEYRTEYTRTANNILFRLTTRTLIRIGKKAMYWTGHQNSVGRLFASRDNGWEVLSSLADVLGPDFPILLNMVFQELRSHWEDGWEFPI